VILEKLTFKGIWKNHDKALMIGKLVLKKRLKDKRRFKMKLRLSKF